MSEKRFYLENDEWVKYEYSEIREYVDEKHISIPLRNDELCKLLNELYEENQRLRNDCSILIQSNQEYRKENDDLRFALRTEQAFTRVKKDKKPFLSKEEFFKELEEDE